MHRNAAPWVSMVSFCGRRIVQVYAACSLWQLVSAASARLPCWREERGPHAALRLRVAIRLLRFFR